MKPIAEMTMEELAAYVCDALEKEGIETVLSGGCCVELYSQGRNTRTILTWWIASTADIGEFGK